MMKALKKKWQTKKLSELSNRKDAIVSGPFGSNLKVSDYKKEGVPILRLQNIGKGCFLNKDIKYINKEKAEELKYHSFIAGDIALAKLGIPIGKTCIIPSYIKTGIITADIVRIRPDSNVVDYNFLEYFLNTDFSVLQLTRNISGATRPRVNLSEVRSIEVPLPSLSEQKRLVALLDDIFEKLEKAKENAEKNLVNAKELFDSYLKSIFSDSNNNWDSVKLDDIATITSSKRIFKKEYVGSGIPFFRTKEIKELANGRSISKTLFISPYRFFEIKEKFGAPQKGDVLLTAIGTIGEIYVVQGEQEFYFKDGNVLWFKDFDESMNPYFLKYALKAYVEDIKRLSAGAAYNALPIQKLKKHKVFVPPLDAQLTIIENLDELSRNIGRLENNYKEKLEHLSELKQSILKKAFTGEL